MKTIVFDLDGTLVETIYDLGNSMNEALASFGYPTNKLDDYILYIGKGVLNMTKCALHNHNIDDETLYKVLNKYNEIYHKNSTNLSKPYPNMIEVLDELTKKGYNLAVISNKPDVDVKKIINHFFGDRFIYVSGAKDDVARKPDKEAMTILCNTLNLNIEDIIYVGDSRYDAEFSINSGCPYFLFEYGYEDKEILHQYSPVAFLQEAKELLKYL